MSRLAFLSSLLLFSLAIVTGPAMAGDYYGGGYHGGHYGHRGYGSSVWYSSDCCFRKIVRHERSVRFVRKYDEHRHGYYDDPHRYGYYDRPVYRGAYYDRPYYNSGYRYGGGGHYAGAYDGCGGARVRVPDGYGGWVWSVRAGCL